METKTCTTGGGGTTCQSGSFNTYFGGKLVKAGGKSVAVDRLGSVRGTYYGSTSEVMRYYPYGEERTSTSDGREKFGTYTRDSSTQDYADQRYYNVGTGRFNVADPYRASSGPGNPGNWNRYAYTEGDPVNSRDPKGLLTSVSLDGIDITDYSIGLGCDDGTMKSTLGLPSCFGGGGGDIDGDDDDDDEEEPAHCTLTVASSGTVEHQDWTKITGIQNKPPNNRLGKYYFPRDSVNSGGWFTSVQIRGSVSGDASQWTGSQTATWGTMTYYLGPGMNNITQPGGSIGNDFPTNKQLVYKKGTVFDWLDTPGMKSLFGTGGGNVTMTLTSTLKGPGGATCGVKWQVTVNAKGTDRSEFSVNVKILSAW